MNTVQEDRMGILQQTAWRDERRPNDYRRNACG